MENAIERILNNMHANDPKRFVISQLNDLFLKMRALMYKEVPEFERDHAMSRLRECCFWALEGLV